MWKLVSVVVLSLCAVILEAEKTVVEEDEELECSTKRFLPENPCYLPEMEVYESRKDRKPLTECGAKISIDAVQDAPQSVMYNDVDKDSLYTLVMVDPDAPGSRFPDNVFKHWLVTNIPAKNLISGEKLDGQTVTKYMAPKPPSGTHRYNFYLVRQNGKISDDTDDRRGKFNLKEYLLDNNMCGTGNVEAGVEAGFQYKAHK